MENNKPLLNEPEIEPTDEVLKPILKESYIAFEKLSEILTNKYSIIMDWKYYKDSKAWLCKVAYKKKTIFWLSIWEGYFKISFFFLERHLEGITKLGTNENSFELAKEWGKMIPLIFNIYTEEQFSDLLKIVEYKKGLK
ncbi:MAG: DUF3788 domain-containing protein [Bacteroidetes bacterium]|nr:DUF3788 domain-containing protein [Bacteroidota bacterium]